MPISPIERFSVSRVSDHNIGNLRNEIVLRIENARRGSTVPAPPPDRRKFSLAQLTREALPRLDNYRISKRALKRPSIGELHGDPEKNPEANDENEEPQKMHSHFKLGWIQGVFIPCLLNIWGVMLFLRLSWVVGQSGIIESFIIIGVSALICVITTLSLSAISTNGEVKGGGIYYIISRSLGPEFGASVGIVFAFANSVAASMNTIGFCDSMNDLLKSNGIKIFDNGVNDTRLIGSIALMIMIVVCAVGMEWEVKAQNFLVLTILAAMLDFLIGAALGPEDDEERAKGFMGFSMDVLKSNLHADYRPTDGVIQNMFTVFAIYFPAVTGIQAGANISGDLKDPSSAIPKGTLLALVVSMISYVIFVMFAGGATLRDASGNVADLVNMTGVHFSCADNHTCEYGLINNYSVMQLMSIWGWLIYAGCFAATLSTALTNLLSVPRLLQALGLDRIYPGMIFFSKGYGKTGEPYRGYVLVLIISIVFLLIADLNAIAPLISNFYLAAYAMINFCTFHAAFVKPLGWRPSFKCYNAWLSLVAALFCVAIMFLLSWISSLITFGIIFTLYLLVLYRKPDVNWGSSTQEQTYKTALSATWRLQKTGDHIKNYHPQILVLAGSPHQRPALIDLGHQITKNHSLLIVGDVIEQKISYRARNNIVKEAYKWLNFRKIKAFYSLIDSVGFEEGVRSLIQSSGFGKLTPNILLMGFKSEWRTCPANELITYFNVLHNTFDQRIAVAMLRLPNGIDYSYLTAEFIPNLANQVNGSNLSIANSTSVSINESTIDDNNLLKRPKFMHCDSNLNLEVLESNNTSSYNVTHLDPMPGLHKNNKDPLEDLDDVVYATRGGSVVPKELLDEMNIFNRKQPKGTIDVWWLYDDGGLTMLLPYILSTRSQWSNCKIRIFALTNRRLELEVEERNMANLLSKLRIDYSSLTMLEGITEKPKNSTIAMHQKLIDSFMEGQNDKCFITKEELKQLEEKTNRQLRLREMLGEYSSSASLIVMSMPIPRQGSVSAPLYMSWLEMLTKDMPPFLFIRGNQTSVLTFYS